MSTTPPEVVTPDERLHDALIAFTGCVGEALEGICSYGLTIGETYVPFDPDPEDDCEEDEVACSQVWVRVTGIQPLYQSDSFDGECGAVFGVGLEVGVQRCVEIPEDGAAPLATDVMLAAMQAMTDMRALYCAALDCKAWDSIKAGAWTPSGPLGGQYGGVWTFSAEL